MSAILCAAKAKKMAPHTTKLLTQNIAGRLLGITQGPA